MRAPKSNMAGAWHAEVTQALCRNQHRLTNLIGRQIPHRLRSIISAADILQELAVDAYKAPPNSVKDWDRWLTAAARSALLNTVRNGSRLKRGGGIRRINTLGPYTSSVNLLNELAHDGRTPSRIVRAEEAVCAVSSALASLPEDQRTVLNLSRFEGLSRREIAERTGRSEAMVAKLVSQGLSALRQRLEGVVISISTIGSIDQPAADLE